MSVPSYPFNSLSLKLPNKEMDFPFPPLKLTNKRREEYSKIILFIPFHFIQFPPPKWSLKVSNGQFKFPKVSKTSSIHPSSIFMYIANERMGRPMFNNMTTIFFYKNKKNKKKLHIGIPKPEQLCVSGYQYLDPYLSILILRSYIPKMS